MGKGGNAVNGEIVIANAKAELQKNDKIPDTTSTTNEVIQAMVHPRRHARQRGGHGPERDAASHIPRHDGSHHVAPSILHTRANIRLHVLSSGNAGGRAGDADHILRRGRAMLPHLPINPPRNNIHKHCTYNRTSSLHRHLEGGHLHVRMSPPLCRPCRLQMRTGHATLRESIGLCGTSGWTDMVGVAASLSS